MFDDNYFNMLRGAWKAAGMSDEQIEAQIQSTKEAAKLMMDGSAEQIKENAYAAENFAALSAEANEKISAMADMFANNDNESEFEMIENPSVNTSYQWAIACGADLGYMRCDVLNDLTTNTYADKEMMQEMLSGDWGIDGHDDVVEMCDSLLAGRHSDEYNKSAKTMTGEHASNIKEALPIFEKDGLIVGGKIPNMVIWDLGRLVNVCRFAFDAGWLSRAETMKYLAALAPKVRATYKSWKELSVGYQFGRAVWGGFDEDEYSMMKNGMEELLSKDESPWKKLPFDMKLEF